MTAPKPQVITPTDQKKSEDGSKGQREILPEAREIAERHAWFYTPHNLELVLPNSAVRYFGD